MAIDGRDVDDEVLKPGWVAYPLRTPWREDDVSTQVHPGTAVIELRLAGGWFTEDFGHLDNTGHVYGSRPAAAVDLEVILRDGSSEVITHPDAWSWAAGPTRSASIYQGETCDARVEPASWQPAQVLPPTVLQDPGALPVPVLRHELLEPVSVEPRPGGRWLLDFGQNVVGRIRLRGRGRAGDAVTLRHAEVLEHGELALRPLRRARATDTYVFAGTGEETWEPEFTYHGFRYVEVFGWAGRPERGDLRAVVLHSALERTGTFSTSHLLLDRLHENVVWSARGNFVSIPTDCPQRDERLGWTGDLQVFAPTAAFLFDCREFLRSWLKDLALEQGRRNGIVPVTVPDPISDIQGPVAAWGDAATIVPWTLYERYGDLEILREAFPSMRDWVGAVERASTDGLWTGDFQFGDWLDPSAPPDDASMAMTDPDLIATAYFYRSTTIAAAAAALLQYRQEADRLNRLAQRIRQAFSNEYVSPNGLVASDSATAYAIAIEFGLLDPYQRDRAGARLATLVKARRFRISTGFAGTPLICDALANTNHEDESVRLLLQTEGPSWLHPVTLGATTIWERWDSMRDDGTLNPGEMTSFNHYALGAVADFMHRRIAGIAPAAPGYSRVRIDPIFAREIPDAAARFQSVHGEIAVSWRHGPGDAVQLRATIPRGVVAEIHLPDRPEFEIGDGIHELTVRLPARRGPASSTLTLDSPLSDLAEHDRAYRAVMAVLADADPTRATALARGSIWSTRRALSEAISTYSAEVRGEVREVLADVQSTQWAHT